MRKCQTCNYENSDAMNFCVQCGATLAHTPMIINLQDGGGTRKQSGAETVSFNKSMETVAGRQSFPKNFQPVPPARPKSKAKIFLIIGGILSLFLLLFAAIAAVVGYNLIYPTNTVVYNPSPTPVPSRSVREKSPTPSPSVSPSPTPSSSPSVSPSPNSDTTASARFDEVRVDYDVTENGRYGMRIHVDFSANNMKGVESYLAVFFQKKDGTNLTSSNREFRSTQGQLAVYKLLKPTYDETDYKDLTVFMPYEEFKLKRGKYNLKLDVDLLYKSGDLLQHLTLYDFEYEKL